MSPATWIFPTLSELLLPSLTALEDVLFVFRLEFLFYSHCRAKQNMLQTQIELKLDIILKKKPVKFMRFA